MPSRTNGLGESFVLPEGRTPTASPGGVAALAVTPIKTAIAMTVAATIPLGLRIQHRMVARGSAGVMTVPSYEVV